MTYMEYKDKRQKEINELPMYFAFSDKQFNELMIKLGYDDKNGFLNDIMSIGGGSIILKKDKELIVNDKIRMYEKGKIKMYKIVHKYNPKVHSFVIL